MFRALLAIGIFAVCVGAGSRPAHAAEGGSGTASTATKAPDKRFEVIVTPEMRLHSRIIDTLYFVDTALGFAMLAFVLEVFEEVFERVDLLQKLRLGRQDARVFQDMICDAEIFRHPALVVEFERLAFAGEVVERAGSLGL